MARIQRSGLGGLMAGVTLLALVAVAQLGSGAAFYLPGVPPVAYKRNARVPLYVNKIESTHTQLAYEYYSLPFCAPEKIEEESENLGEVLAGDRMSNSLYQLFTRANEYCKVLCRAEYTADQGSAFAEKIADDYTVDWMLDNLPAAVRLYAEDNRDDVYYEREFPLGFEDKATGAKYLFNHIRFTIKYNPNEDEQGVRIVGFEVEPFRCVCECVCTACQVAVSPCAPRLTCTCVPHLQRQAQVRRCVGPGHPVGDVQRCGARVAGHAQPAHRPGWRSHLHLRRQVGVVRRGVEHALGPVQQDLQLRHRDPLALHRQLGAHRLLPHRHDRHDPHARPVQGHR